MNKLKLAVLSCVLVLPLAAAGTAAADGYFFATAAGRSKHLEIWWGQYTAVGQAQSRGPVAGQHRGQTYVGTTRNTGSAQIYANIRCGTVWIRGPIKKLAPNAVSTAVRTNCTLDRPAAQVWEGELEWQP